MRTAWPLAVVLAHLACGHLSSSEPAPEADEHQVKAAYLAGFARFIERPDRDAVVLCSTPDVRMLEAMLHVAAKAPGVDVRSVDRPEDVAGCTVLFIARSRLKLLRDLAGTPYGSGVLIVGDGPSFINSGGALEFIRTKNRIQFNASIPAMQRSGVRVSSRLLGLARNLRESAQ